MHIKPDFRDVKSLYFFISPYSFIFTSQLIIASITTNHSEQRGKKKNLSQELQLFKSTLDYSQLFQFCIYSKHCHSRESRASYQH